MSLQAVYCAVIVIIRGVCARMTAEKVINDKKYLLTGAGVVNAVNMRVSVAGVYVHFGMKCT